MKNTNPKEKRPPFPKPNGADAQFRIEVAPSGTMSRESWKIFQIMAEFVAGFEQLSQIQPSVSIFGSSPTITRHTYYPRPAVKGEICTVTGLPLVSGGGPG